MTVAKRQKSELKGDRRILYVSDPSSLTAHYLPNPVEEIDLRRLIGMMAEGGVDMYCQDIYSQCWTAYWRSEKFPYDQRMQHERYLPLLDAGVQPAGVLLDECHKHDMLFMAGFRVNDGHGYRNLSQAAGITVAIEEVIKKNPDWELTEMPSDNVAGADFLSAYSLDFSREGVRDYLIDVIREAIETFDLDGVELCFRDPAYFPVGTGRERADLMTDLFRQVRAALDAKAKTAGRKLLFGARVCHAIDELLDIGLDVKTWVAEALIDYISPQDTMWVDFNFALPEFGDLTAGTDCLLYPGLNPWSSQRQRIRLQGPVDSDAARAFAHTCYQNGADGISPFNHCVIPRVSPFYPQQLQIFYELRDPQRVAAGIRHYMFDSPLAGFTAFYDAEGNVTAKITTDKILLDRSDEEPSGEYKLNLYEEPGAVRTANLLFRGFHLTHDDELEICFNGQKIDNDIVGRTRISNFDPDKENKQGKDKPNLGELLARSAQRSTHREYKGRLITCAIEMGRFFTDRDPRVKEFPPCSAVWFPLDLSTLVYGINCLSVKLAKSDPRATEPIVIEEVEMFIVPE